MAVEILTVSLSDESIERVARRVAQIVRAEAGIDLPGVDAPVTQGNPPSPQNPQPAESPGFQQQADPWLNQNAPQAAPSAPQTAYGAPSAPQYQSAPPQPQQAVQAPTCAHGPMRYVPAGQSQSTGRSYPAFWGCPLPRGAQGKCKSVTA